MTFDAHDPARLARFWADVLGRVVIDDLRGALLPGLDTQVGLQFAPSRAARVGPNRVHLHLTSISPTDQQHTIAAALELGASHLDVGQLPEEGHVVLAEVTAPMPAPIAAPRQQIAVPQPATVPARPDG